MIRFTPTGVGTIASSQQSARSWSVHPHGRGDNGVHGSRYDPICGSPPRAWGQSSYRRAVSQHLRFTPTGVGTISVSFTLATYLTVHPHGRGDNSRRVAVSGCSDGSPPRAWGQYGLPPAAPGVRWFTPTGVGTICASSVWCCLPSVHPHGRGDNLRIVGVVLPAVGSPPRAWGQYGSTLYCRVHCRFTPTGVGTIWRPHPRAGVRSVHPHGRGDNFRIDGVERMFHGSPPRAWGQSRTRVHADNAARFTPTGVGTINSPFPGRA